MFQKIDKEEKIKIATKTKFMYYMMKAKKVSTAIILFVCFNFEKTL